MGNALLLGIAVGISEATISGCLSAAACGLQFLGFGTEVEVHDLLNVFFSVKTIFFWEGCKVNNS